MIIYKRGCVNPASADSFIEHHIEKFVQQSIYCSQHIFNNYNRANHKKAASTGHVVVDTDAQFLNNRVNYQYPAWSPPMQYPQVPQQRQQQYPQQSQQRWFYDGPPQQTWLGREAIQ